MVALTIATDALAPAGTMSSSDLETAVGAVVGTVLGITKGAPLSSGKLETMAATVGVTADMVAGMGLREDEGLQTVESGVIASTAADCPVVTVAEAIASGNIGGALVRAVEKCDEYGYSFDCWKPVLHDDSESFPTGIFLTDLVMDPRVELVEMLTDDASGLPQFVVRNVWDEKFRLELFHMSSDCLAAHAVKL